MDLIGASSTSSPQPQQAPYIVTDNLSLACIFFPDANQVPQMIPSHEIQLKYNFQQQQVPEKETNKTSDCLLFIPSPVPDHYDRINCPRLKDQKHHESSKWMSSKMRLMKKMMVGCQSKPRTFASSNSINTFKQQPDQAIRVCSDCKTTKTPLWRSGPTGPKSLCNACGIRQRKARRAAALSRDQVVPIKKRFKIEKAAINDDLKLQNPSPATSAAADADGGGENRLGFKVFPQDEKEAAILLMALSCGANND